MRLGAVTKLPVLSWEFCNGPLCRTAIRMTRLSFPNALLPILLCCVPLVAQGSDELLTQVDRLRHPWPSFTVEIELKSAKATQHWKVTARENGDARVEGLSEKEKGRAVLVLGDAMWLLLPGTKRPIKVTPQQKLLGPAAGGDIARTRFAEDYSVKEKGDDVLDSTPCWRLALVAKRPSTSFRTANLWVTKNGTRPIKAEFFLPSGKLAKNAVFAAPQFQRGAPVLIRMDLVEPKGATAEVHFDHWAPAVANPTLFELPIVK